MGGIHIRINRTLIPSLFTLANLFCGYLAIVDVVEGTFVFAAWWIIIAALFDTLDGKIARLTGGASRFGIEFDSLADVVSFGAAPAILFYQYALVDAGRTGAMIMFMFLAAGAVRLARFNTKATTKKKNYFTGMPIPSGAGLLAAWVLFAEKMNPGFMAFDFSVALVFLVSFAMVSTFKYSALPRISFSTSGDIIKSTLFFGLILLLIIFPDTFFFPVGMLYLASGPVRFITAPAVNHVWNKVNNR